MRMVCNPGGKFLESCRLFLRAPGRFTPGSFGTFYPCRTGGGIDMVTVIDIVILAAAICLAIAGVYVLRGTRRK